MGGGGKEGGREVGGKEGVGKKIYMHIFSNLQKFKPFFFPCLLPPILPPPPPPLLRVTRDLVF
jgi:hypothetical protein